MLIFISFYPKIPLAELIPGYIVRVRLEDIILFGLGLVFLARVVQHKASLRTPITAILTFYVIVGILVMLNAMFVVKSLPLNVLHVGKMALHFLRRLEYFSIFFLFYNALKNWRHVRMTLIGITIIMLGISLYGFGQKYLYWPVYSTMNREFSKGMKLVLTEHARVPSTFGGHYDMSAFVMFALTLILSLFFFTKRKGWKAFLLILFVMGFWLLILGSSRSSFIAYLLAISVLVVLVGLAKRSWVWMLTRGVAVLGFSLVVMLTLGDLSSRFSQLGFVQTAQKQLEALTKPVTQKPSNTIAVEPLDVTDERPIPVTPVPVVTARPLPPDVYKNIPDQKTITATVGGKTVTQVIQVPREFSDCTYVYGLSACIRFETLWPRAINGFMRDPLLGSGYSTLTKASFSEFTEAESTDNDFLRNLGESGILGVIGFYGPIAIFFYAAIRTLRGEVEPISRAVLIGILAGSLGMFLNAAYIDVFEASKVAFLYWSVLAVGFVVIDLERKRKASRPATNNGGI